MAWNDAIVRVCVGDDANGWNIGTGFFVAKGLILTAHHVITEADGEDPSICVASYHGLREDTDCNNEPRSNACSPCGAGFVQAKIVWQSEASLDVTLLSCDPGDETVLRLAAREPEEKTPAVSGGFPSGAKVEDTREYFPVSGDAHPRRSEDQIFQYDLTTRARQAADWGGMSGAPVFQEGTQRVLGVVVRAREAMKQSGYLEVVPAALVARAEGFAQHFGDWRSHELPDGFRDDFLEKIEARLDVAISDLNVAEMDDLLALVKNVVSDFTGEVTARTLFNIAGDIVKEIGRTQSVSHREDPETALQFGLIGQLLYYDSISEEHLRLISYVGSNRDDATADPFSCLAHTLPLLEVLAAATDGLDPMFPDQRDPAIPPGSDVILPFAVREDGAASPQKEADNIAHLARKTGVGVVAADAIDTRIDSFFRGEGLLYPEERDPANWDFTSVADELSIRLSAAKARSERSYVLPAIRPEDVEAAATLRASLQRLKGLVPELLIMGLVLDEYGARAEERDLEQLLNTIPVKNTRRRRLKDDQR